MSFIGGLFGGMIGASIFGQEGIGKYVILNFSSEKEFEDKVEYFRKSTNEDAIDSNSIGGTFEYNNKYYVPIEIISEDGSPCLDCLFFIRENNDKVAKEFALGGNTEK